MIAGRSGIYFLIGVKFKLVHHAALKYLGLEFCFAPYFGWCSSLAVSHTCWTRFLDEI